MLYGTRLVRANLEGSPAAAKEASRAPAFVFRPDSYASAADTRDSPRRLIHGCDGRRVSSPPNCAATGRDKIDALPDVDGRVRGGNCGRCN